MGDGVGAIAFQKTYQGFFLRAALGLLKVRTWSAQGQQWPGQLRVDVEEARDNSLYYGSKVFSTAELQALADVAIEHDLLVTTKMFPPNLSVSCVLCCG